MSGAEAQPVPVVELSPIELDAQPKSYPAPVRNGTGLLVSSGIIATGALIYRGFVTSVAVGEVQQGSSFLGPQFTLLFGGVVTNPFFAASLGMMGGGMGMRGRWQAHHDMFETGQIPKSRLAVRPGLGWALAGAGVGVWVATRFAGYLGCVTDECSVATLELGAYGSLGMVTAGMALGAYGTGYRRYTRDHQGLLSRVRAQPVISRTFSGLSVSGRF